MKFLDFCSISTSKKSTDLHSRKRETFRQTDRHVTYSSQSTATMRLMSCVGRPTAVNTRIIVMRPALGTLAAPTLARVAVKLQR